MVWWVLDHHSLDMIPNILVHFWKTQFLLLWKIRQWEPKKITWIFLEQYKEKEGVPECWLQQQNQYWRNLHMPSCTSQWLISHYNHNVHKMFIKKITICILLEQSHANGMISWLEKFLFFFLFFFFFFLRVRKVPCWIKMIRVIQII